MTLLGYFSKNIALKLHVTFFRISRVTFFKLCQPILLMSRVKSGEICHALLWGRNWLRVTSRVTGFFSEECHGLVKKCHEKKNSPRGVLFLNEKKSDSLLRPHHLFGP